MIDLPCRLRSVSRNCLGSGGMSHLLRRVYDFTIGRGIVSVNGVWLAETLQLTWAGLACGCGDDGGGKVDDSEKATAAAALDSAPPCSDRLRAA
jgi:hypothetical protein